MSFEVTHTCSDLIVCSRCVRIVRQTGGGDTLQAERNQVDYFVSM